MAGEGAEVGYRKGIGGIQSVLAIHLYISGGSTCRPCLPCAVSSHGSADPLIRKNTHGLPLLADILPFSAPLPHIDPTGPSLRIACRAVLLVSASL